MNKKEIILLILLIFLLFLLPVSLFLVKQKQEIRKKAVEPPVPSAKKGVAGGATLSALSTIKTSWFYNWGYTPAYKDTTNNWDPQVWQKFVPLFYGKSYLSVNNQIQEICQKTDYCNKGNYYLIGNEPDNYGHEDWPGDYETAWQVATQQGEVIKRVRVKDPTAKFIILGLMKENDREQFIDDFVKKWKEVWQNTNIAILPEVIAGWHFHTFYFCNPNRVSNFASFVNNATKKYFGKTVSNQEIWVTEMGKPEGTSTEGEMECFVNTYENSPLVTRYAWFYFGCSPNLHSFCPASSNDTSQNNVSLYHYNAQNNSFNLTNLGNKYSTLALRLIPTTTNPLILNITSTPIPTRTPTITPTALTPTRPPATSTPTLSPAPTNTPRPTASQTPSPTRQPTLTPSPIPGDVNTPRPTATLTPIPTQRPLTPTLTPPPLPTPDDLNAVNLSLRINFFGVWSKPNNPANLNYQTRKVRVIIKKAYTKDGEEPEVYRQNLDFSAITDGSSFYYLGGFKPSLSLPSGEYHLLFKGPQHLQVSKKNVTLLPGTRTFDFSTNNEALPGGDLPLPVNADYNNLAQDGIVNSLDYAFIVNNFNSTETKILNIGDLNLDGIINTGDTTILAHTLEVKLDEDE